LKKLSTQPWRIWIGSVYKKLSKDNIYVHYVLNMIILNIQRDELVRMKL
jgi:hypothetical protein